MSSVKKADRTRRLVENDGGICHLCGGEVRTDVVKEHPTSPTRDHVIPRAIAGAGFEKHEIALAHRACNEYRGTKHVGECKPADFAAHLKIKITAWDSRKRKLSARPTIRNKYIKEL